MHQIHHSSKYPTHHHNHDHDLLPHNSSVAPNQTSPDPSALPPSPSSSYTAPSPSPASDPRPTATKIASDLSQTFIYPHPFNSLRSTESPSPPWSEPFFASESTKSASTACPHSLPPILPQNPPIPAGNPVETTAPTGGTACAPTHLRRPRGALAAAPETPRKRSKTTARAREKPRDRRNRPSILRIYVTKPDHHDGTWPVRRWSRLSPRPSDRSARRAAASTPAGKKSACFRAL